MLTMMEFDHIAIFVGDVDRSAAFYEKVFQFERVPEPFHDGLHIWLRIGAASSLHIVGNADAAQPHEITHHMAFRSGDISAVMRRLDEMQVAYRNFRGDGKVNARRDGVRQIYFQDPDGYWIEVNDAVTVAAV